MSEHPYTQGRKGDLNTPLATWMVAAGETIIDLRKVISVGPLISGGIYNKYTVTFIGGGEMTIWDNGSASGSEPVIKRPTFIAAWAFESDGVSA